MFSKTIFVGLSLTIFTVFAGAATAAGISHQSSDGCNRRMRSQVRKFSAQVKRNLEDVSGFPMVAEWVDPKATGLIASAFNVKPEDVEKIYNHPLKVKLADDSRLQLELEGWPQFQRTLVSLRQPTVIQDLALAQESVAPGDNTSVTLALESSTRMFYVVKDLGRNQELGFVLPVHDVMKTGAALPFYEMQLAIVRPCPDAEICVDDLVRFTTWPEQN